MARATYIYFVRMNTTDQLLGAFTVKHEAVAWAVRVSKQPLEYMHLSAMRDGLFGDKSERRVPWPVDAMQLTDRLKPT